MGGIQSQVPALGRSRHPWGASRVRPLPRGGAGTPGGHPESGPCPREEQAPLGGIQSQAPAPGRSGHPWGASRVRPLPRGGGLTLGASAHMGSVPEGTSAQPLGSLQNHLPRVRLSQERVGRTVAHPVQVWALVSARQAARRLSTSCPPTNQQEDVTLSGQTGQWVKLTCPSVRF